MVPGLAGTATNSKICEMTNIIGRTRYRGYGYVPLRFGGGGGGGGGGNVYRRMGTQHDKYSTSCQSTNHLSFWQFPRPVKTRLLLIK